MELQKDLKHKYKDIKFVRLLIDYMSKQNCKEGVTV